MSPGLQEKPLLTFPEGDSWTVNQAFEGTQIFGSTGSGKTTGSGQAIALGFLKSGMGGLVLTAKIEDCEVWKKYARAAGRPKEDIIVFGPTVKDGSPYSFNFLKYESETLDEDGLSFTDNVVNLFCTVMEVAQRGGGQGDKDAYWIQSVRQLLRNAIDLISLSGKEINFPNIYNIITSAPASLQQAEKIEDFLSQMSESINLEDVPFFEECMYSIDRLLRNGKSGREEEIIFTVKYLMKEFPALAPETRSIVVSYFTGMADCFLRGMLKDLFSTAKNQENELRPELTHEGKIIILNLPVKKYYEAGQLAQVLYKYIWQRAAERRKIDDSTNPIFLWADEAQFFVNSKDALFQTTARSARVATVYLTQNISNYYAIMPGDKGRAQTDSLLGNFQTKIFHANGDSVTNLWAAELIGKNWDWRSNKSSSISSNSHDEKRSSIFSLGGGQSNSSQFSSSKAETLEFQVLPIDFTTLKKGGVENDLHVEAFLFQGGRVWANGKNYKPVSFLQKNLDEVDSDV